MSNDIAIASLKEKIDDLNQQAWDVRVTDLPKSFELSQESVNLARSINYPKGLAEGLRSLGFSYVRYSKNDEAAPLLKESLSLYQSLNDLKGQAVIYEYLGIIERNWGNLGASLDLLLKANELILQTGPPELEITCSYQLGVTYKHLGNHENALDYLYKTLSLAKKINLPLMEAYATNIIGSIYFDNGNYNQALDCYQQGLPIRQQSHDKWGEAGSLDNIGFTYLKLNHLDKAIEYCKQSLAICQGTGDKKGEANTLLHLAEIYEQAGDVKQAAGFSNESLAIRKDRGDKRGETEVLLFLADLYKNRDDVEDHQIFEWLSGALKIADEIKAQDLLSKAYYNLHEYYQQKGNFKESLVQLEAHFQIEKELHKNSINQKVANLEISHKAEVVSQRNKELTELNEKIEKANEELKIERSLERVRATAMAMKGPADMLEVCKIISDQLEILDVKKVRNVQTAIFYEEKNAYTNYEYYAKHDKLLITEVDYNNHPVAEKFANQMLKGPNQVWTHGFKGEEVKDWLNYQRSTNVFIDTHLETADSLNYYWYSLGPVALGMSTYAPLSENEIDLFKRFRNVFELAYRRYLDIEKAEAQAREAQIELALERVRARTMAMHHSGELADTASVLFQQIKELGFETWSCGFCTWTKDDLVEVWMAADSGGLLPPMMIPYKEEPTHSKIYEASLRGETAHDKVWEGKELEKHYAFLKTIPSVKEAIEILERSGLSLPSRQCYYVGFFNQGYLLLITKEPNADLKDLSRRFARVFEQTYTRFLDLQKAEEQAREAKIEAALERARTQSMIMQHSKELDDTLRVFHEQVLLLGINSAFSFLWLPDEDKKRHIFWAAWAENVSIDPLTKKDSTVFNSKAINYPLDSNEPATAQCLVDWKGKQPVVSYHVPPIGVESYFAAWQELIAGVEQLKPEYFSDGLYYVEAFMKYGCFGVMVESELSEDKKKILSRFAVEFERTYTRFLDLQKAEAQAREAQIEAALEKVRSRSLAMHKSEELQEVVTVVFDRLKELDIQMDAINLDIFKENIKDSYLWTSVPGQVYSKEFHIPFTDVAIFKEIYDGLIEGKELLSKVYSREEKNAFFEYVFTHSDFREVPENRKKLILDADGCTFSVAYAKSAAIMAYRYSQTPFSDGENEILKRFAKVFEQCYTRFKDLQKAEAQAREAQIEAALERVRTKAMAMHKSDDLKMAVATVFEELDKLNLGLIRCGIAILDKEKPRGDIWITIKADHGNTIQVSGDESLDIHPLLKGAYDAWLKLEDFSYVLQNDDLIRYYQAITKMKFQQPVSATFTQEKKDQQQYYFNAVFQDGSLFAFLDTAFTDEAKMVMKRFANVFNLTYKRFLDLQKAEAQAREAKIEAALERVRARALAMQEPEELKDVAEVLRAEMGLLGVEELETCSIYINDESAEKAECWYALKDIRSEGKKLVSDHFALNLNDTWVGRGMLLFYQSSKKQISIVMQGENRKEWIRYCEEHSAPFRGYYGEVIPDRTYHLYKFSHGAIGAAAAGDISEESWRMLNRAASVFSLAYSRFKDLTQARTDLIKLKEEKKRAEDALTELQTTQKQLIQAEKMASLGELTAGIAHEIQNPLNFVNNFSDVSNELLEEMKSELEKGNAEGAKEIAIDVKENLEKILHHGKRADAIVKGMLQHSRTSSGQKELTDINVLADEYLRLAYHGLRAKDKFFNAKFETDLDPTISKINIVPQEIGRVILNLINNSFYAVSEKKKLLGNGFEPTVTVSTKAVKPVSGSLGAIEIMVKDNGIGIPQKALDKIFQPFFTTKPTGQGTGLGLSLSYDIITKGHDGEIKVETKEGEGSAFIISLPMK